MSSHESGARFKVNTTDLGEGGLAISLPRRSKPHGRWELKFTLPGSTTPLEVNAEFAWEGTGTQVGLRFQDQSPAVERQLREWLGRNSPEIEKDDPPVRCQLMDLSLGGCYLEITSPFPISTRVTLSMRAAELKLKTEGVVRVMHPTREWELSLPDHSRASGAARKVPERAYWESRVAARVAGGTRRPGDWHIPEFTNCSGIRWR